MALNQKLIRNVIGIIAVAGLPLWINIGSGPLSNLYTDLGKKYFNNHQFSLAILWIFITILLFICYDRYNKFTPSNEKKNKTPREELLESLWNRYQYRKSKKMDSEINFHLEIILEYIHKGITDKNIRDYYISDYRDKLYNNSHSLYDEFETNIKRLLIVGQPGSGKTVLLLTFALHFIEKARTDVEYPIPIIINLATWRSQYKNFESWLEENLSHSAGEFGVSKSYSKELANKNNILLLLDGLDEVPIDDRNSCLKCLEIYLKNKIRSSSTFAKYPQVIICSRRDDYNNVGIEAYVRASMMIAPLNKNNLLESLAGLPKAVSSRQLLINQIDDNPRISQMLQTAFNVHLALHLVEDFDLKDFDEQILLGQYVLLECKKINGYTAFQIFKYLHHLAFILGETKKVVTFELTDLQPFWTEINSGKSSRMTGRARWFQEPKSYRVILESVRTFVILIFASFTALHLNYAYGTEPKTILDIYAPYLFATIVSIFLGILLAVPNSIFFSSDIIVKEVRFFNPKEFSIGKFIFSFKQTMLKTLLFSMTGATLFGILGAFEEGKLNDIDGGFRGALKDSFYNGLAYMVRGLEMTIFPKTVHYIVVGVIFVFCLISIYRDRRKLIQKIAPTNYAATRKIKLISRFFSEIFAAIFMSWWIQGVVVGFCYGFYYGLLNKFLTTLGVTLFVGLCIGVFIGLVTGIFNGVIESVFTAKRNIKIHRPYNRFLNSFVFDFLKVSTPISILIILLFASPNTHKTLFESNAKYLIAALSYTQIFCLLISVYINPIVKHFSVRLMLLLQGKIPIRYSYFLNQVSRTGIMEKDGGQWRFRHQLIQELFSETIIYNDDKDGFMDI